MLAEIEKLLSALPFLVQREDKSLSDDIGPI